MIISVAAKKFSWIFHDRTFKSKWSERGSAGHIGNMCIFNAIFFLSFGIDIPVGAVGLIVGVTDLVNSGVLK